MEDLVMRTCFASTYAGRRVLVTGHTGFKGSWLVKWLESMEADVTGIALDPATTPSHWALLHSHAADHRLDIRDADAVKRVMSRARPEIVFHLAAQPLVRRGYREPAPTWATNVLGTAHVLDAVRETPGVRAVVVVTTDKCYDNKEWPWGYRETDPLGGHDPYSASKAGSELVVNSYRSSYFNNTGAPLLATSRAGNVVGGGDWSEDRLIPDLVRSLTAGKPLTIRSPRATRPWQHVLDCLSGYLQLGQELLAGRRECAEAWNFGPEAEGTRTVEEVLRILQGHWPMLQWQVTNQPQPHEAALLHLDCAKARVKLGWRPVWELDTTLARTASWYRRWQQDASLSTEDDLCAYVSSARRLGLRWADA